MCLLVESSVACLLYICTPLFIVTLLLYRKVAYPCLSFLFHCIMELYTFTCHFCFVVSWSRALLLVISVSLYYEVVYLCLSFPFRCTIELYTFTCHFCFVVLWSRALLLVISVLLYYKVVHLYLLLLFRCIMRLEASPFHNPVSSRVAGDAGRATVIESTDPSGVAPH